MEEEVIIEEKFKEIANKYFRTEIIMMNKDFYNRLIKAFNEVYNLSKE